MVEIVTRTLRTSGFRRLPLRTEFGPAHLSSPPEDQAEYERRDGNAVVEAILYWESSPGEPTSADRLVMTGMDIRFAICQPRTADLRFREIVVQLVQEYGFLIHDTYSNRRYSAEQVSSYLDDMTHIVTGLRANWRHLFGPEYEERVLSAAEAWRDYLNPKQSEAEKPPT